MSLSSVQAVCPPVNPLLLKPTLRETYDLISDLSKRAGACYARASWLAEKLGISESALSRRLGALCKLGLIMIEHVPGLRRLLRPVSFFAPAAQPDRKPDAKETQGKRRLPSLSGESESSLSRETTNSTPPPAPGEGVPSGSSPPVDVALVDELCKYHVSRKVAEQLAGRSAEECRRQIAALPAHKAAYARKGKPIKNVGGFLREAITGRFDPPEPAASDGSNTISRRSLGRDPSSCGPESATPGEKADKEQARRAEDARRARGKSEEQKAAEEEAARKAKREAAERARASVRPNGMKLPPSWQPPRDTSGGRSS